MRPTGLAACLLAFWLAATAAPAEVRFGGHVQIGGHDVSRQRFNRRRRGLFHLHQRRPDNEGCRWRRDPDGSRTKICRFPIRH